MKTGRGALARANPAGPRPGFLFKCWLMQRMALENASLCFLQLSLLEGSISLVSYLQKATDLNLFPFVLQSPMPGWAELDSFAITS